MTGQDRHSQRLLELLHHAHSEGVRICVFPLLNAVEMELLGILGAQLQQGQFVSPLGNAERNAFYLHIGQKGHNHFL